MAAFLLLGLLLLAAAGQSLLGERYTGHPLYGVEGGSALSQQVWILDSPQLRYIGTAGCWVRLQLCNPQYLIWEEGELVQQPTYQMEYQTAAGYNQSAWEYREGWYYYRLPVYPCDQGNDLACLFDAHFNPGGVRPPVPRRAGGAGFCRNPGNITSGKEGFVWRCFV